MLRLLFVICLAVCFGGMVAGDCGTLQRVMVKSQWGQVKGYGRDRTKSNLAVWKRIFQDKPDAKAFFKNVDGDNIYSAKFKAHMARVNDGMDMAISMLDDQPVLDAVLAHLNKQHKNLGVGAEYFTVMREAIMDLVSEKIGPCFDFAAWNPCLTSISNGISA